MDLRGVSHILYTQDDCQTGLSQFSSYYYRVVSGLLDAEKVGATTVAPLMPFVPCNDAAIEADPTTPAQSTILTRYSVDCRTFLDLSATVVCDLDVFLENAAGKFHHSWAPDGTVFWLDKEKRTINTIESDGAVRMVVDSTAPCAITAMPPAWGVGKPIMTVLSATNKYKFRLGSPPAWPHPGYEEFLDGSKKYLVVHWKRGSNLSAEHGQTADDHSIRTDPDRVGESINYLISVNRKANPQSPADGIFIATDSTSAQDRAKVVSIIRKEWTKIPVFMTPILTSINPADRWRYDWADLWVGSRGSAWFLGPYCAEDCSTFGRLMISNGRRFNDKLAVTFM
jgi:hypothetical protein